MNKVKIISLALFLFCLFGIVLMWIYSVCRNDEYEPFIEVEGKDSFEYGKTICLDDFLIITDAKTVELSSAKMVVDGKSIPLITDGYKVNIPYKTGKMKVTISAYNKKKATHIIKDIDIVDTEKPTIKTKYNINVGVDDPKKYWILKHSVSAFDEIDGDISDNIIIDDSSVDYEEPNSYLCEISVWDSSHNYIEQNVKLNILPPNPEEIYGPDKIVLKPGDELNIRELYQIKNPNFIKYDYSISVKIMRPYYSDTISNLPPEAVIYDREKNTLTYNYPGEASMYIWAVNDYYSEIKAIDIECLE